MKNLRYCFVNCREPLKNLIVYILIHSLLLTILYISLFLNLDKYDMYTLLNYLGGYLIVIAITISEEHRFSIKYGREIEMLEETKAIWNKLKTNASLTVRFITIVVYWFIWIKTNATYSAIMLILVVYAFWINYEISIAISEDELEYTKKED